MLMKMWSGSNREYYKSIEVNNVIVVVACGGDGGISPVSAYLHMGRNPNDFRSLCVPLRLYSRTTRPIYLVISIKFRGPLSYR